MPEPPKAEPVPPVEHGPVPPPRASEPDPAELARIEQERSDVEHGSKEKRRLARENRALRRTVLREVRKDRATAKDISKAINDLSALKSSLGSDSLENKVKAVMHDLSRIESDVKGFNRLRRREERLEEREHNHYLQLLARLQQRIDRDEARVDELLEHEQRAHRALYTRFTALITELHQTHDALAGHETGLESLIRKTDKLFHRIAYEVAKGNAPSSVDLNAASMVADKLIELLRVVGGLLEHAIELERRLASFERKGTLLEKREMREDRSELKGLTLPGEHTAPIRIRGLVPAPREEAIVKKTSQAIIQARGDLERINRRFAWLYNHLKHIESISNVLRAPERELLALDGESRQIKGLIQELRSSVRRFDVSVAHIANDDSALMKVVLNKKGETGRVLGRLKRLEEHKEHPVSPEEYEALKHAIHARVERIERSTQNLHKFANWLERTDAAVFKGILRSTEPIIAYVEKWHELRSRYLAGQVDQRSVRWYAREAERYLSVLRSFAEEFKMIGAALIEYERLEQEEDKLIAEDRVFFEKLAAARTNPELLSVLRST